MNDETAEAASTAKQPGSHLKSAFDPFLDYTEAAESLVHLTHEGLSRTLAIPELFRVLEFDSGRIDDAEGRAARAKREIDAGFPTLHAHSLLGLYGALECLVEDIVVASIRHHPSLLASERFSRIRLPVALMAAEDSHERYAAIVTEAARSTNSDIAVGVTKYERLLQLVGLDGPTPRSVRDAVYLGQQIRNVWAHRGGIADSRLVEACPTEGFVIGQRVDLDVGHFLPLMHAVHMYGIVVLNRHLAQTHRALVFPECPGYEGCLAEIWPNEPDASS